MRMVMIFHEMLTTGIQVGVRVRLDRGFLETSAQSGTRTLGVRDRVWVWVWVRVSFKRTLSTNLTVLAWG